MFKVRFTSRYHKDTALKAAPKILQKNLSAGLEGLGKRLVSSAKTRMRRDRGDEQKSLRVKVRVQGLNMNMIVFSTLIQAFVDAYGLRRGVFPDFKVNSRLYDWAKRRLRNIPTKQIQTVGTPAGPAKRAYKARIKKIKRTRKIKGQQGEVATTRQRFRAKNSDIRRLAFLVARAIFRKGIQAGGWPKKTLEANKQRIVRDMQNAMARAANEIKRA